MKLLFLPTLALAASRTFIDDAGVTHTTDKAAPTIIGQVKDMVSLEHMGVPHAQVIGTFGERCTDGSNLKNAHADGYADMNGANKAAYGDHDNVPYDSKLFPSDPVSATELAMLDQAADLTPSCSATCYWCPGIYGGGEITQNLNTHGWPDFILQGAYGGSWPFAYDGYVLGNATAKGVKVISILDNYNDATGAQSIPAGYIEITKRYEELAIFLGVTDDLSSEKRALCAEVNNFKATAAAAAARGVRAMGTFAPWSTVNNKGELAGWFYGANIDSTMMMMEELGMQILHVGDGAGWEGSTNASMLGYTAANFPYSVDLWLYDTRVVLDFTSDAFSTAWPQPALVADQYAYWPNGGHVHSFAHGTEILKLVGEALGKAQRIAPATTCTVVADVTDVNYRVNGIANNQYACPKPVEYDWCLAYPSSTDSAYLARPGVVVVALAAVAATLL